MSVVFVWDETKDRTNRRKHGLVRGIVILLVVHTIEEQEGEEKIRIISARKAVARERDLYAATH